MTNACVGRVLHFCMLGVISSSQRIVNEQERLYLSLVVQA